MWGEAAFGSRVGVSLSQGRGEECMCACRMGLWRFREASVSGRVVEGHVVAVGVVEVRGGVGAWLGWMRIWYVEVAC